MSSKPSARRRPNGVCVVLIDVINAFDFANSGGISRAAKRAAPCIERLAWRARESDIPVIYVNDNFGRWRSNFRDLVRECTKPDYAGSAVSTQLRPHQSDFFVLKPQHSGFYSTPLHLLLDNLGAHTLILAGFATNLCVLFTANDAHMHGFHLSVPRDCVAANTLSLTRGALNHLETALGADTRRSSEINFGRLARRSRKPRGQAF
ncbi:MAG: cysteine hydrolase [Myxococcota bacterium]|nr:cysteine hydrolase [Myxococcota bacterium]